jgi:hypothetical protein
MYRILRISATHCPMAAGNGCSLNLSVSSHNS